MDLCNINVIRALLEGHGFKFSKAMGQNFLTADWVPKQIAAESLCDEASGVLEIGPGIGCLTKELSAVSGKVVAVELDKRLPDVLKETLRGCDNVEIISGDIMKIDISSFVDEHFPGLTPRVCANLPYNITSPVLTKLLSSGKFESITVMIQREVAKRICSAPNTADYGAFTLFVQYYARPSLLFDVTPDCFIPQPKVTSSVIRLDKRENPPVDVASENLLFRVIRAAFNQRRKTLSNALSMGFGEISKEDISSVIAKCGLSAKIRGEALSLNDFAAIANGIDEVLNGN